MTTGGGNPRPHDGQPSDEPTAGPAAPSGVSPVLPPMIVLTVPLGGDRGDFVARFPVYEWEAPTFDVLEAAIRHTAEQAVRELRAAEWLWEDT